MPAECNEIPAFYRKEIASITVAAMEPVGLVQPVPKVEAESVTKVDSGSLVATVEAVATGSLVATVRPVTKVESDSLVATVEAVATGSLVATVRSAQTV